MKEKHIDINDINTYPKELLDFCEERKEFILK